jgi:hypothetical protein
MKNVVFGLMALIYLSSCEAQSTTDPNSNVVAQDPKCLLSTQWSIDYKYPTPHPDSYWFTTPTMNFNTATEGFFDVGVGIGKFRNNDVNNSYEIHFNYSVSGDRVIFEIKRVVRFRGLSTKIGEETGAAAIATAKELMNFVNLDNGIKSACTKTKMTFSSTEPTTRVPFSIYHWERTN